MRDDKYQHLNVIVNTLFTLFNPINYYIPKPKESKDRIHIYKDRTIPESSNSGLEIIKEAFIHYRNNGTNETFELYPIDNFSYYLEKFKEEEIEISRENLPTAASTYYKELKLWWERVNDLEEITYNTNGMGYFNLPDTVPHYAPEQLKMYLQLYNQLINNLRDKFLTKADELLNLNNDRIKQAGAKKTGKEKLNPITLPEIWSDSKQPELYTEISLLLKNGYINKNNDQTYQWLGKQWKKLAAITEIWKEKNLLKSTYQRFGSQRELCGAVCRYLGIAEDKIQSVYNTGFKESLISIEGQLNNDMIELKQEISLSLQKD